MYSKFSFKDAFVIILSLISMIVLIFIVKQSNEESQKEHDQLNKISTNMEQNKVLHYDDEIAENLVINEVNQAGWIELYNLGTKPMDLSNFIIEQDGKSIKLKSDSVLEPKSFIKINLVHKFFHGKEQLIKIYNNQRVILKQFLVPELDVNESYGCINEGAIEMTYMTETPEKTNTSADIDHKEFMYFSIPGGFYDSDIDLSINVPSGWKVYYTLDGTTPTTDSEQYGELITIKNISGTDLKYAITKGISYSNSYKPTSISQATVVRALAVDQYGNEVQQDIQTYFIGMNNARDHLNIPIISLTTEPKNLFDYFEGIYVLGRTHEDAIARGEDAGNSANFFNDWKKPIYIEYFEGTKDKTYEGNFLLSIINDISVKTLQKSLLLEVDGMFDMNAYSSIAQFLNSKNELKIETNKRDNNYKIRDYLAAELLSDSHVGVPNLSPCILYINGEYWGGYMLKECYDEEYISKTYEINSDNIVIAIDGKTNNSEYQQYYDELETLIMTKDMSKQTNYELLKEKVDIQSFLDYFCANMYLANTNYRKDSLTIWRTVNTGLGYEDGKWRFLLPSLDNSMDNGMTGDLCTSSIDTFLQQSVKEDVFFRSLLVNDEFRTQLKQTMIKMQNVVFTEDNVTEKLNLISDSIGKMAISSYKRFVGNPVDTFFSDEVKKITTFFIERGDYILLYTDEVVEEGSKLYYDDNLEIND